MGILRVPEASNSSKVCVCVCFNNDLTEEGISPFISVSPDIIRSHRLQRLDVHGSAVS